MATAVLFIGWNRPSPGHENEAYRFLMGEAIETLDTFQKQGYCESQERVGLTAHGGDLNGFILLFGERAKLDELRRTDAFERFAMRLSTQFVGVGVIPGVNWAGMQKVAARNPDLTR